MILTDLLSELKQKNIYLYLDNGSLRGKFPQNTATPELKAALQTYKTELIAYLRQTVTDESLVFSNLQRGEKLPLSYAQERLWFLDQFEPGSTSYNMPGAVRLTGELDVKLLERSLNEIIRR
ncbi:MAG: condensation domain-containing protein, partial [Nitrosomonas sp.]